MESCSGPGGDEEIRVLPPNRKADYDASLTEAQSLSYYHDGWLKTIRKYSGLKLTYEADRLTTLRGLTTRMLLRIGS